MTRVPNFSLNKTNTVVSYNVTSYYSPEDNRGLFWNAPNLKRDWPIDAENATDSDKDRKQPRLTDLRKVAIF